MALLVQRLKGQRVTPLKKSQSLVGTEKIGTALLASQSPATDSFKTPVPTRDNEKLHRWLSACKPGERPPQKACPY